MATYRIAVLGAGKVGGTLGKKWLAAGHEVTFLVYPLAQPGQPSSGAQASHTLSRESFLSFRRLNPRADGSRIVNHGMKWLMATLGENG